MNIIKTDIKDALILEPQVHEDGRGYCLESWNKKTFQEFIGKEIEFVQDNHSRSTKGVLRGLHYQKPHSQGKLVRVSRGSVLDVVVDLRKNSPSFGKHIKVLLTDKNKRQLWVPEGMAHGFLVVSEIADFLYKTTDYWYPEDELSIKWNDKDLDIDWEYEGTDPIVSEKDSMALNFKDAEYYFD